MNEDTNVTQCRSGVTWPLMVLQNWLEAFIHCSSGRPVSQGFWKSQGLYSCCGNGSELLFPLNSSLLLLFTFSPDLVAPEWNTALFIAHPTSPQYWGLNLGPWHWPTSLDLFKFFHFWDKILLSHQVSQAGLQLVVFLTQPPRMLGS